MFNSIVDVTIIATKRSELLRKTLTSFFDNLLQYVPCRAIVNVDPIGLNEPINNVIKVVEEFLNQIKRE